MKTTLRAPSRFAAVVALVSAAWALLLAWPALAADLARPEVIGFSADGQYVAFEEYGAQDGSGFPYANIYVIDVDANSWVSGSPVRVLLTYDDMSEDEMMRTGIDEARRRAMQQARPVLDRHGIVPGNTGTTVIHHPHSDLDADPYRARFSIGATYAAAFRPDDNLMQLTVREASAPECRDLTPPPTVIFTLDLSRNGAPPTTLQRDDRLFASRGCPVDYRIHSVVVHANGVDDQSHCCAADFSMLVLVGMATVGFEGPDWRFLGVTGVVDSLR